MTALATMSDADGLVYLPSFGASLMTHDRAMQEAEPLANLNGVPCGIWQRAGWYTVCEHAPESITPDPTVSGWHLIAVMDPSRHLGLGSCGHGGSTGGNCHAATAGGTPPA